MIDDPTLLRRYATNRSDADFAEFVRRHLPLVYAAAVRRLGGDAHRAEDVAQVVFCAAARDARRLAQHPVLTGWLYVATRNAVNDVVRAEQRRRAREQAAHLMHETSLAGEPTADWSRLRPVLDAALDELNDTDREAVLLRYFQDRPFAEVGAVLGLSEDTARKRVERAVDKLGVVLRRHRIVSTSTVLTALLAGETLSAAPASLAASITTAATATGGAAAGTFGFFALPKLQLGVAAVVAVGGAASLMLHQRATASGADDQRIPPPVVAETAAPVAKIVSPGPTAAPSVAATAAKPTPTRFSAEEKAKLHRRYDPFLMGQLHLTPGQADRFVELKLTIFEVQKDLQAGMVKAGAPGGSAGVETMRAQLTKPMWDEIRALLGEEGYVRLRDYESVSAVRPMVAGIFESTGVAVSTEQVDQVARLALRHNHLARERPTDLGQRARVDWDAVVRDAAPLLTKAQLDALQRFAQSQSK